MRKVNILVELFLLGGHVHTQDLLHLGRQGLLHVLLDAPQQEGLQDLVEALVAVIPRFPMFLLKILPGLESEVSRRMPRGWLGSLATSIAGET